MARPLLLRVAMRLHRLVIAASLVAAAACGSDDGTSGDPITGECRDVRLEVGTGNREFTPVADGDTVFLFRGPQGGYMLYISVRASGIDPTSARLCYEDVLTATETRVGAGCWNIQLPNDLGGGMHERVGVWAQIDPSLWGSPGAVRGQDVRVDVTLSDSRGCSADGSWTGFVSPDAPQ